MDQTSECETPDSGIFSPSDSTAATVTPSNNSTPTVGSSQAQPINHGHLLTPMDSGIASPMAKNDAFSQPIDAQKLESALNLHLTVTGPGGKVQSISIPKEASVDELIEKSAQNHGLGTSANIYLMNGAETLQRGSKLKVNQTKLVDGNRLQIMTRTVGG